MSKISKLTLSQINNIEYLIVLGCRIFGEEPGGCLRERLKTALELANLNKNIKIICSGAKGDNEDITEALSMERFFIKNNIDSFRIYKEENSHSTVDNFRFSRKIIEKINRLNSDDYIENTVFVTNDYHIFRANKIGSDFGFINLIGIPAYTPIRNRVNNYFREILSILNYFIFVRKNVKSKQYNSSS